MNVAELLVAATDGAGTESAFTTRGRTITEADLTSFSAVTGDWHPQHCDAQWASRSRFSGRIAHGMLVLSYAIGLLPLDPERVIALRGLRSVNFKRPVRIGDTIRARCRVESVRPADGTRALVRLAIRVVNQDELVVVVATLDALCNLAPAPVDGVDTSPLGGTVDPRGASARSWPDEIVHLYGPELFL